MKEVWQRTANTILLGALSIVITAGMAILVNITNDVNYKLNTLMIQSAVTTTSLEAHIKEVEPWTRRIISLEKGNAIAIKDRITKKEALLAIDNLRRDVDKYYQRK